MDSIWSDGTSEREPDTPSIRTSGSLLWVMELPPRTRIETPEPAAPLPEDTRTPGSLPWRAWAALDTGISAISLPVMEATDPVRSRRLTVW